MGEEEYLRWSRFGELRSEPEFREMHTTRLVAELAGLIRKYKGKFILSRECRKLLAEHRGNPASTRDCSGPLPGNSTGPMTITWEKSRSSNSLFCSVFILCPDMAMSGGAISSMKTISCRLFPVCSRKYSRSATTIRRRKSCGSVIRPAVWNGLPGSSGWLKSTVAEKTAILKNSC